MRGGLAPSPAGLAAQPRDAPTHSHAGERARPEANRVAVMLLVDMAEGSRLWGWSRYVVGRFALAHAPGLRFFKILGSGHEGGFGLRPSCSRQGLFCIFDDDATADAFLDASPLCAAYRARAREYFAVKLRAFSSRGQWAGVAVPISARTPSHGPIVTLTRASIRLSAARAFWRMAAPAERSLEQAPGCLLAAGVGEAPLLRQATFSVWDSLASMDAYARHGAHLQAIQAAHRERYFTESMFVRFVPSGMRGTWKGRCHG